MTTKLRRAEPSTKRFSEALQFSVQNRKLSLHRAEERKYCKFDNEKIIGVDEAGRGPLAGPVVAAACFIAPHVEIDGIIDSKATKETDREITYELLTKKKGVMWGVSVISHEDIDEINILQASLKAMANAVADLLSKYHGSIDTKDCHILVDGNKIPTGLPNDSLSKVAVIKGDSIIYSIAAASIIAKVTRDRIMTEMDKIYPLYGFAQHKGYPTAAHRSILMAHGPCPIHRVSYGPVLKAASMHSNYRYDEKGDTVQSMGTLKSKTVRSTSNAIAKSGNGSTLLPNNIDESTPLPRKSARLRKLREVSAEIGETNSKINPSKRNKKSNNESTFKN